MAIDYSDLEALLAPVDGSARCGTNLEYSDPFFELERELQGKPEFELGGRRVPARPPDWSRVESLAKALIVQTKDLRVAIGLLRALLAMEGLPGLARGLSILTSLAGRYWDCLFPELEDGDPTARLNVLAALSDRTGILRQLRETMVVYSANGEVTVHDLITDQNETARSTLTTSDREALEIRLRDVRRDDRMLDAIADSARWLNELRETLRHASIADTTSLDGLAAMLDRLRGWSRTQHTATHADPFACYVGGDGDAVLGNDAMPSPPAGPYFKVYRPVAVSPETWSPFLVYLHGGTVAAVDADSRQRLGSAHAAYDSRESAARVNIPRGVEVTVVPTVPGCRFNPRQHRIEWAEDVHCVEFRLQASVQIAGFEEERPLHGSVRLYVGPLLVGEVRTSIVASRDMRGMIPSPTEGAVGTPFSRVFVSYAHEDAEIIDQIERTYELVRIEYLRDVSVLRAGDRWNARILEQIDRADRFQLCWSDAARNSRFVEQEWRHALAIRERKEDTFICPFYWQKPMPSAPPELADLHFAYWQLDT